MIPKEKVNWFKQYLFDVYVTNVIMADPLLAENSLAVKLYKETYSELEFVDYIYVNCYKLLMSDEELEKWIDKTQVMQAAMEDLHSVIGKDRLRDLDINASMKLAQWSELNRDEFTQVLTDKQLNI